MRAFTHTHTAPLESTDTSLLSAHNRRQRIRSHLLYLETLHLTLAGVLSSFSCFVSLLVMPGCSSPREHDIQFSNSSSFSSVSNSSVENASIVQHLRPLTGEDAAQPLPSTTLNGGLRLPPRRVAHVDADSVFFVEEVEVTSRPLMATMPLESRFTHTHGRDSSSNEEDNNEFLHSTTPDDSHRCSFSAARDSASPPTMSSYFCAAAAEEGEEADAGLPFSRLWEVETFFEEIPTPRSMASAAIAHASHSRHASSLTSPTTSRILVDQSPLSPPVEAVAVNASHAREAHERLFTFSTATMAQYQLVKLKARQRLYRVYYDKWRGLLARCTPPRTPHKHSKLTQTPSVSMGSDFVDIDSFHASRPASAVNTPRTSGAAQASPLRQPSPSPFKSQGVSVNAAAWSASPSVARPQSPTEHSPSPEARLTQHDWQVTLSPPPEGIAVRTKPSKLVDFGCHSDAPLRKSAHVSNPVVKEPRVVSSPERIIKS